jgi:hypothetical protein
MRFLTPVVKYWVCKSAPGFLYEAMECMGGNGYVEEGILARHYREAPVNAIWEGSGNVMCLDVLRGRGTIGVLKAAMQVASTDEGSARLLTEQLALSAAAAELRRLGAGRIADAFVETRLAGQWRNTYGMLDSRHEDRREGCRRNMARAQQRPEQQKGAGHQGDAADRCQCRRIRFHAGKFGRCQRREEQGGEQDIVAELLQSFP